MAEERFRELLRRAGVSSVSPAQVAVVAVLALACVGWFAWRALPNASGDEFVAAGAEDATPARDADARDGGSSRAAESTAPLVVHVVGAVSRPGVYTLPTGSRVADAVNAAGGALGSAASQAVNFARLLTDGEQIALPTKDEWEAGGAVGAPGDAAAGTGASGPTQGAGGKVNLNTADEAALDALPGVGPATAKRIVEDRTANGPFAKPEDLMRVSGIGEKKYDALKDLVVVG